MGGTHVLIDNPAFVVGLGLGALMLLSVCWVYVRNQTVALGGLVLTVCGVILIGMSVWRSIDVSVDTKGIRARLAQVEAQVVQVSEKTTAVEQQTSDLEQRFEMQLAQEKLTQLGFYDNAVDGLAGPLTRLSIRRFQASKGLPETGELDERTKADLGISR
jgi:hypothetical protein